MMSALAIRHAHGMATRLPRLACRRRRFRTALPARLHSRFRLLPSQDGPTPVPADDVDVMEPLLAPVASLTSGTSSAALPLLCETDQQREQRRRRREWVRPGYWQSYAFMVRWRACVMSTGRLGAELKGVLRVSAIGRQCLTAFKPLASSLHCPAYCALQAAWLAALLSGYAVQRAACQVGLPYDGLQQASLKQS